MIHEFNKIKNVFEKIYKSICKRSSMHLLNKYLLTTYYVPSLRVCPESIVQNKTDIIFFIYNVGTSPLWVELQEKDPSLETRTVVLPLVKVLSFLNERNNTYTIYFTEVSCSKRLLPIQVHVQNCLGSLLCVSFSSMLC